MKSGLDEQWLRCDLAFTAFTAALSISMKFISGAQRADEAYNGIFIGESHLSSIDSFQTLATCAMLTQRMLLGSPSLIWFFAIRPVLAGAAASLNEISKGRGRYRTSHAHTGAQSLSRKCRDVCRDGDTVLQKLKSTVMRQARANGT